MQIDRPDIRQHERHQKTFNSIFHTTRLVERFILLLDDLHDLSGNVSPLSSMVFISLVDDVLVRVGLRLISGNLLVLARTLLHQCLQLGVIVLGDGLWLHLDDAASSVGLNVLLDVDNSLLKSGNTEVLLQAGRGEDVEWWGDELDLDLSLRGVAGLSGAKCGLDCVDALISEAGNLNIGADLCWLWGKALSDI